MSAYNVINPTSMVTGQPEDVGPIKQNFDSLASILNGHIDATNFDPTATLTMAGLVLTTNSALALRITGGAGGITFGGDANLYHFAAQSLKTDGTFRTGAHIVMAESGTGDLYMRNDSGNVFMGVSDDTRVYRRGAGVLGASPLRVDGDLMTSATGAGSTTANSVWIGHDGGAYAPRILFGNDFSVNLYRGGVGQLTTTAQFAAYGYDQYNQSIIATRGITLDSAGGGYKLAFSTGADVLLFRQQSGVLDLTGTLRVSQQIQGNGTIVGNAGFFATAASVGWAYWSNITNDSNARWVMYHDGNMNWGPGNTTLDTNLYRYGANKLGTSGAIWMDQANGGAANALVFGSAGDAYLYRSGASTLKTDGSFYAVNIFATRLNASDGTFGYLYQPASISGTYTWWTQVPGETAARFVASGAGYMQWGPGTSALDTNLYRLAANQLKTDSWFSSAYALTANQGTANEVAVGYISSTTCGIGFGSSHDTNLYRSAAAQLKTDGSFIVTGALALGNGAAVGGSIYGGAGVPGAGTGTNGDYYFRNDGGGPGATHIYYKNAGAWFSVA